MDKAELEAAQQHDAPDARAAERRGRAGQPAEAMTASATPSIK